jgi:hypothetical protein
VTLISFAEAEAIGLAVHDRIAAMGAVPPMRRDDLGWGDLVQFVLRSARSAAAARGGVGGGVEAIEAHWKREGTQDDGAKRSGA